MRVREYIFLHAILRKEIGFLEEQNLPWDFFPFLDQTCLASLHSVDNRLIAETESCPSESFVCPRIHSFLGYHGGIDILQATVRLFKGGTLIVFVNFSRGYAYLEGYAY